MRAGLLRPEDPLHVCEFQPVEYCLGNDQPVVVDDFDTSAIDTTRAQGPPMLGAQ